MRIIDCKVFGPSGHESTIKFSLESTTEKEVHIQENKSSRLLIYYTLGQRKFQFVFKKKTKSN